MTIENPDNEIDYLSYEREVNNLKRGVESGFNEDNLKAFAERTIWIPESYTIDYINTLKGFYKSNRIPDVMDNAFKDKLWFKSGKLKNLKLSHSAWLTLFYIKKRCPNNFEKIAELLINNNVFKAYVIDNSTKRIQNCEEWCIITGGQDFYSIKHIVNFIGNYGDSSYDCLKFCLSFYESWMLTNVSEDSKKAFEHFGGAIQFFENFIQRPKDSMNLFAFLKENPQRLENLWWKLKDMKIDLDVNKWINFAFRGIIQMIKSKHLTPPDLGKLGKNAWKKKREEIIQKYGDMLRDYIAEDDRPFDTIFFSAQLWDRIIDNFPVKKEHIESFWKYWCEVFDYSQKNSKYIIDSPSEDLPKWENEKEKMIRDIKNYVERNRDKKVLICIEYHGNPDWSSENWWTKEDWEKLATDISSIVTSSNVKIWSNRCFFGKSFNNIYNLTYPVSWFSNSSATHSAVWEVMASGIKQWLWFNELEIYTRLNYPFSAAPLTMRYDGKIVWIAQNDEENNEEHDDQDIDYA